MVDYKAQLAKGFSAHQKVSVAKQEVASILNELSRQVMDFTEGRIGIALKRETTSLIAEALDSVASITNGLPTNLPLKIQYNLVAYDKSRGMGNAERLASWMQARAGYPCTLRFDDTKHEAYDRKSLETILGELLASPETGRIISSIMSKEPKAIENTGEASSE
ncbi:hypothetical protein DXM29_19150 [Agrobacterium tumefaciens]|uniref:hypothetical protein n=1 Tax=Agrobacterium tumefaciens TaxID=358 RepID=UPI00122FD778|nr:hypothetical protein DXM29_19150 [Agrobacterium tumefaciens]